MSILNKYKRWIPCLIPIKDEYWDFVISQEDCPSLPYRPNMTERCLSSYIEFGDTECQETNGVKSYPTYTWDGCDNDGVILNDIGYTGIDNGLIYYGGWERVTNREFYDIFTNSVITIEPGDCRLHMHQVTGNTGVYSYPMEYVENKYYTLSGGFFQGFYKLHGFDYQVLPQYIEDEWNIEVTLRPRFLVQEENTLNATHPDNEGIFFFMGARAEDKFLQFYNTDLSKYPEREQPSRDWCDEDYFIGYEEPEKEPEEDYGYLRAEEKKCINGKISLNTVQTNAGKEFNKRKARNLTYFLNTYGYNEFSDCKCAKTISGDDCDECENGFFADAYIGNCRKEECTSYLSDDDYIEKDIVISGATILTSDGNPASESGYYEIKTDNKFLTFNRTKYGFTTANWDEDTVVVLTGSTNDIRNDNLFLLMHRGCGGYTTETIDEYYSDNAKKYDFMSDMFGNAFAIKRNSDGSLSYRYLVMDCDKGDGYDIIEETSFPDIVPEGKWSTINIKFGIVNGNGLNECGYPAGKRKMKIQIYVNGRLKFISKELPEFDFREFSTTKEKQEGVPFNISVGGGTQGLCDSVWLDYFRAFEKILPIEKHFAGTFIGDLMSFRFYTCKLQYAEIRNNWLYNRAKWS